MIESDACIDGMGQHWVLRPNRSLSLAHTRLFFALVLLTALLVTGFSWLGGNVFAPLFAVIDVLVLALVFWLVWRRAERAEVIQVRPERVSVNRMPELVAALDVHPRWVRVELAQGMLYLASHGRRVRVGEFLGESEREQLRNELEHGLKLARDQGSYRISDRG